MINEISRIIKPGGLWLVMVPDINSLSRRILQKKWPHFNIHHKIYFSRNFFKKLVFDYPFKIEHLSSPKNTYNIFYMLNQTKINSHGFLKHFASMVLMMLPKFILNIKIRLGGGNLICVLRRTQDID